VSYSQEFRGDNPSECERFLARRRYEAIIPFQANAWVRSTDHFATSTANTRIFCSHFRAPERVPPTIRGSKDRKQLGSPMRRRLRHKETDSDDHQGHDTDRSFPRGRPHREVSFRRRCSLSLIISLKSTTGRISIGPSPYLNPGCCETS